MIWTYIIATLSILVLYIINFKYSKICEWDVWYNPPRIWTSKLDGSDSNKQLFDVYAIMHFVHGMFAYLVSRYCLGLSYSMISVYGMLFHTIFEITENTKLVINMFRRDPLNQNYEGDSLANILGDSIAYYGGIKLAHNLDPTQAVIFILLIEIVLFHAIGHNTINMIIFVLKELYWYGIGNKNI